MEDTNLKKFYNAGIRKLQKFKQDLNYCYYPENMSMQNEDFQYGKGLQTAS